MAEVHDRGFLGEQSMGFTLGEQGYQFIDGPSGAGGHGITSSGFDGVAFNPKTGDLILGDNKTFKRVGNVTSATAIDPGVNLQKNLRTMIKHVETHPNLARVPSRDAILQRLRAADRAVTQWIADGRPPGKLNLGGVRLVVFNAWGKSTGVGGKLGRSGAVQFQDLNASSRTRVVAESTRVRVATEPPRVRVVTGVDMRPVPAIPTVRSVVLGSMISLGSGIALGILQAGMKDAMLKSLENLKQPRPDPRDAPSFFSDPNTGPSIRFLNLLNKNLKSYGRELEQHHTTVITSVNLELMLLAASRTQPISDRLEFVSALRDELLVYGDELDMVFQNLDAAQSLSPKVQSAAQGAEQLAKALEPAFFQDQLLKAGWDYEDILAVIESLKDFSSLVRRVFQDIDSLRSQVDRLRDELRTFYWQLLKLSWVILLTPLVSPSAAPKPAVSLGSQRVLDVMGPGTPILRLSQIRERLKQQPGDFIPSIEAALRELRDAGLVVLMESRGVIVEAWKTNP
jgi:hypothetical protein